MKRVSLWPPGASASIWFSDQNAAQVSRVTRIVTHDGREAVEWAVGLRICEEISKTFRRWP